MRCSGHSTRSHHHKARGAPLCLEATVVHRSEATRARSHWARTSLTAHCCEGMSFAEDTALILEVVVLENDAAVGTGEATGMEFAVDTAVPGHGGGLQVLSFDPEVAAAAKRAVLLVVVVLAVRVVVDHVEVGRGERLSASPDRKSTRLNSSHSGESRMPSSA